MVARIVFLPIEEITFSVFSRLLSSLQTSVDGTKTESKVVSENTDLEKLQHVRFVLFSAIKLMMFIGNSRCRIEKLILFVGIYFITFGPSFSFLLLHILYGYKFSDTSAPSVLAAYCFYVFFMAINGKLTPY